MSILLTVEILAILYLIFRRLRSSYNQDARQSVEGDLPRGALPRQTLTRQLPGGPITLEPVILEPVILEPTIQEPIIREPVIREPFFQKTGTQEACTEEEFWRLPPLTRGWILKKQRARDQRR